MAQLPYYFQLNICSPGFLGGLWQGEVKVVVPVNHFIAFSYSVGLVTVKYSSLRAGKYFHNLRKCY